MPAPAFLELFAAHTAGVAWSPLDLPDLIGWWDASNTASITDAGAGAVSQWDDLSGVGNHFTQGTGANRPTTGTRTVNGKNALDFVPTQYMTCNADNSDRTQTTFVVALQDTTGSHAIWGGSLGAGNEFRVEDTTRRLSTLKSTAANLFTQTNAAVTNGQAFCATQLLTATTVDHTLDGVTQSGSDSNTFTAGRTLRVGHDAGAGEAFDGLICELIRCSVTLTAPDIALAEAYLKSKWGTP